jgi:YhcH/YjgK/YiaL family protein
MVADSLRQAPRYAPLHPAFAHAFGWLAAFATVTPDGNHDIGEGCEARVMSYQTEPAAQRRWESHRRYIDIQLVITGAERMEVGPVTALDGATGYDATNDVTFYAGARGEVTSLVVDAGTFAIFWPDDAHRPNIAIGAPSAVRKVVVKVPVVTPPV